MAIDILLYLICFFLFVVAQSIAINGIKLCFEKGMIFYDIAPSFFERTKGKAWTNPLWGCIRCMSSVYSILSFFPVVIYFFGWHPIELLIWAFDAFILVYINYFFYKNS